MLGFVATLTFRFNLTEEGNVAMSVARYGKNLLLFLLASIGGCFMI